MAMLEPRAIRKPSVLDKKTPDYIRQQNREDLDAWYKQHFLPWWKKQNRRRRK